MECRKLEITLVSANHLPDVRNLGQMKVYAKVSIKGESKTTKKSPVDMQGETDPRWNFTIDYTISESSVQKPGIKIAIELYCKRTLGDRFIGEVNIPVKSLFDKGIKANKILSYPVGGTPEGRLSILYSFGEKVLVQKPSGWGWKRTALEVGFLVLIGGAMVLLGDKCIEDDGSDGQDLPAPEYSGNDADGGAPGSPEYHRDDDDDKDCDVFYDAR